jgi:capsular polysaccharide biosynthesis protein
VKELRDLAQIVRGRWHAVLLLTLLGGLAAGIVNLLMPVTFVASSRIFVATPTWNDSTAIGSPAEAQLLTTYGDEFSQMRIPSYQRVAATPIVLEPVIRELGLGITAAQLAQHVTVRAVPDTVMLDVEVRDSSGGRAADISNAVAQQLIGTIKQLEKPPFNTVAPIQPVVISPALPPSHPVSPQVVLNLLLGLAFGFVVGLTYAAFRAQRAATAVQSETERLLGVAGRDDVSETGDIDTVGSDTRFLRVALMAALHENASGSVLLAAPRSSEATLAVATQLADSIAEVGATVAIVVADFSLQTNASGPGLGDILAGAVTMADAIQEDATGGTALLAAGTKPQSTTAALTGPVMARVLAQLQSRFDCVVIVAPAVLETTDAVDLASRSGTCALVCPPEASASDIRDSEHLLGLADARYIGRIAAALMTSGDRSEP